MLIASIIVEPACGEQDIVVTMTAWCTHVCACVSPSVRPSEFIWTATSTFADGFQNNET